ncbi:hypothetical protein E2C01_089475 [Portunus trituberculatus]|uniref:Uncharacterized protein n=1 Tax=Portunus trituberculatus TaxID=210409 RepID=A0A5B7J8W0_PORTR|nr:hypothetical protein [Portunus trituberculatus]
MMSLATDSGDSGDLAVSSSCDLFSLACCLSPRY